MIVRNIKDLIGSDRDVSFEQGKSIRVVLEKDNMGYSVHKTIIPEGQRGAWHYKNHLETCYCVKGNGFITDHLNEETFEIKEDSVYILNNHDKHTFEAVTDIVLISVFNPPCKGSETHREDGSYE